VKRRNKTESRENFPIVSFYIIINYIICFLMSVFLLADAFFFWPAAGF